MRIDLAGCRVDLEARTVDRGDLRLPLTELECALLGYLAARPGLPVAHDELLTEVWGYAPGVRSGAPEATLRRLRRKLGERPGTPRILAWRRGEGLVLCCEQPDALRPPLALPELHRSNLWPEEDTFVGRDGELAALDRALAPGSALVAVTGPPGTGKTRLALRYGALRLPRHPGGVWWVDLAPARTPGEVREALRQALGAQRAVDAVLVPALRARAGGLVILDDTCAAAEAVAAALEIWREGAPEVRWLATSRVRPEIGDAVVLPLDPLPLSAAAALFLQRALAVPRTLARAEDLGEARALAERLDGLPLAIELAAARARVLTPAEIRRRLEGRGAVGSALAQALESSWALLGEPERRALAAASVFRAGFDADAATAVLGDDALRLLDHLIGHSLVVARRSPQQTARYRLLEGIREFAAARADERGETAAARAKHLAWYSALASDSVRASEAGEEAADPMEAAGAELLAAAERCGPGEEEAFVALAGVLAGWEVDHGAPQGHGRWAEAARGRAAAAGRPDLEALASLIAARGSAREGRFDRADALCDAALAADDAAVRASARVLSACIARLQGRLDAAMVRHQQAERESVAAGRAGLRVRNLVGWASVLREAGRDEEAREPLECALGAWTGRGGAIRGMIEIERAHVAERHGRTNEALDRYEDARAAFEAAGQGYGAAVVQHNLGSALADAGRRIEARRALAAARDAQRRFGHVRQALLATWEIGALDHALGDLPAAWDAYDEVVGAGVQGLGLAPGLARVMRARLLLGWGRTEEARSELAAAEQALAALDEPGSDLARELVAALRSGAPLDGILARAHARDGTWQDHHGVRAVLAVGVLGPARAAVRIDGDGRRVRLPDGRSIDLSGRHKLACVLAALVARRRAAPGEPVTDDELCAAAWPELPADDPRSVRRLRVAVGTLRELGLQELLVTRPGGYALDPDVPLA